MVLLLHAQLRKMKEERERQRKRERKMEKEKDRWGKIDGKMREIVGKGDRKR